MSTEMPPPQDPRTRNWQSSGEDIDQLDPQSELVGADDLEKLFTYQPPTPGMQPRFMAVSRACLAAARVIKANCPPSADRTLAMQHLVDARMRANMSIALRGARLIPMS